MIRNQNFVFFILLCSSSSSNSYITFLTNWIFRVYIIIIQYVLYRVRLYLYVIIIFSFLYTFLVFLEISIITTFAHLLSFLFSYQQLFPHLPIKLWNSLNWNISVHYSKGVVGRDIHMDTSIFFRLNLNMCFSSMFYCYHLRSPSHHNHGNFLFSA